MRFPSMVTHTPSWYSAFHPSKCVRTHTHTEQPRKQLAYSRASQLWIFKVEENAVLSLPHLHFLPLLRIEPTTLQV